MFAFYCTSNLDHIYFALTKGDGKMKIEDNRSNLRKFEELVVGDVFEYESNYYIKTKEINDSNSPASYMTYNAVNINSSCAGELFYFKDNLVYLLDDVTLVLN